MPRKARATSAIGIGQLKKRSIEGMGIKSPAEVLKDLITGSGEATPTENPKSRAGELAQALKKKAG